MSKSKKKPKTKIEVPAPRASRQIPLKTKSFGSEWVFEDWLEEPSFFSKRMFGGLAGYLNGKMNLLLFESEGDREWQGKNYDFDLWNGILVCTSREFHSSLQAEFPSLVSHPVLGKWLFLKAADSNFENTAMGLSALVLQDDPRMGIWPRSKKKRSSPLRAKAKKSTPKKSRAKKSSSKKSTDKGLERKPKRNRI